MMTEAEFNAARLEGRVPNTSVSNITGVIDDGIPQFTFRGTSSSPDKVFNEGFKGRGTSTDLFKHALDNTDPPSIYVSTCKSSDVAVEFGTQYYSEAGNLVELKGSVTNSYHSH